MFATIGWMPLPCCKRTKPQKILAYIFLQSVLCCLQWLTCCKSTSHKFPGYFFVQGVLVACSDLASERVGVRYRFDETLENVGLPSLESLTFGSLLLIIEVRRSDIQNIKFEGRFKQNLKRASIFCWMIFFPVENGFPHLQMVPDGADTYRKWPKTSVSLGLTPKEKIKHNSRTRRHIRVLI